MEKNEKDTIYFYQSEQPDDQPVFDVRDETEWKKKRYLDVSNTSKNAKVKENEDGNNKAAIEKGSDTKSQPETSELATEDKVADIEPLESPATAGSDANGGIEKTTDEQISGSKITRAMRFFLGHDSKRKSSDKDSKKSIDDEKKKKSGSSETNTPQDREHEVENNRKEFKHDSNEGKEKNKKLEISQTKPDKPTEPEAKTEDEANFSGSQKDSFGQKKGRRQKSPGLKWGPEPNRVFNDAKNDGKNELESQKEITKSDSREGQDQQKTGQEEPIPTKWRFGRKPKIEEIKSETSVADPSSASSGDFNAEEKASRQQDMGEVYGKKLADSRRRFSEKSQELDRRRKRSLGNDYDNYIRLENKQVQTRTDPRLMGLYGDPFDPALFDETLAYQRQVKPENVEFHDDYPESQSGYHERYADREDQVERGQPTNVPEKDTYDAKDRKMKEALHGFFIYVTFLITVSVIVFSMTSRSAFYLTNAIETGFMDTIHMAQPAPVNESMQGTAAPTVQPSVTTTKKPKLRARRAEPGIEESPWSNASLVGDGHSMGRRMTPRQSLIMEENARAKTSYSPAGVSLRHAVTVEDFWNFMNFTFIKFLYSEFLLPEKDPLQHTEDDDRPIVYSSKLLGVARIRQLRVSSSSCVIHRQIEDLFKECFGYYNGRTESREELNPPAAKETLEHAWVYSGADRLNSVRYTGIFATYGGGGYMMDLNLNATATAAIITELEENGWISQGTRAVIVDFTIYNSNVNLFLVCKIVVEFPPTGGIYPTGHFNALKLLRYVSVQDMIVLGFEHVFILFVACNTLLIIAQIFRIGLKFFKNGWNILDLLILALSYAAIIMALYRYFIVESMVLEIMGKKGEHPPFDFPCMIQTYFDQLCGVLLFFVWIRMFKYLSFIRNIDVFYRTLARSAKSIASFAIMFLVVFLAFVQWAYLIFGSEVEEYRTVWSSAMALLQTVIGRFNYKQLEESNYLLAPVFVISYVFFFFFIMINIFGAIIFESYRVTKSQLYVHEEPSVLRYLKTATVNILTLGRKRKTVSEQKSEMATTGKSIYDSLKRAGYTESEVEVFFARYEIKIDQVFTRGEAKELLIRLEERHFENEPNEVPAGAVAELSNEVQKLQKIVQAYHEEAAEMKKQLKMSK